MKTTVYNYLAKLVLKNSDAIVAKLIEREAPLKLVHQQRKTSTLIKEGKLHLVIKSADITKDIIFVSAKEMPGRDDKNWLQITGKTKVKFYQKAEIKIFNYFPLAKDGRFVIENTPQTT